MSKLSIIFFILVFLSCSEKKESVFPQKSSMTESIYTSVTIQPDSIYQVYAIVSGILEKNLVVEGDLVTKNQPLLHIINKNPELNTQNAKLSLDLAKQNYTGNNAVLEGIKEEINAALLNFKNDSINYLRQKQLWNQGVVSKSEFDKLKLSYDLAKNNLIAIKSKYYRTKNELNTTVKQAENNFKSAIINTKDFTVKSNITGKVYALYKKPGEIITIQEPLATLGMANKFVIEMLVDEVDIVNVTKGQEVIVKLDAYADKVFKGHVTKIFPKKEERNQTFKVEALFETRPDILYPGLSGEANIIVSKKENTLTIPKEYIIESTKVMTAKGLVTIKTGIQNMEFVEVLSGIDEKTLIYKIEK